MALASSFLFGTVMHARLFPVRNSFTYKTYAIAFDIKDRHKISLKNKFGVNRSALMSFHDKDHGARDDRPLEDWIYPILSDRGVTGIKNIRLVCMPRVFGYVFNPVSFWFCYDAFSVLKAVLCEVNNTFGETHSYLCHIKDNYLSTDNAWIEAEKMFHVSPFLPREGEYKFRFLAEDKKIGVQINYYNGQGEKQLVTTLSGWLEPITSRSWAKAFFGYPLVTFRTIFLIHWQAFKLWSKRQKYFPKPRQMPVNITETLDN